MGMTREGEGEAGHRGSARLEEWRMRRIRGLEAPEAEGGSAGWAGRRQGGTEVAVTRQGNCPDGAGHDGGQHHGRLRL